MAKFGKMEMPPMKGKKKDEDAEMGESPEHEQDESQEFEDGEDEEAGEAAPIDLTAVSDDELMAEMHTRGLK